MITKFPGTDVEMFVDGDVKFALVDIDDPKAPRTEDDIVWTPVRTEPVKFVTVGPEIPETQLDKFVDKSMRELIRWARIVDANDHVKHRVEYRWDGDLLMPSDVVASDRVEFLDEHEQVIVWIAATDPRA